MNGKKGSLVSISTQCGQSNDRLFFQGLYDVEEKLIFERPISDEIQLTTQQYHGKGDYLSDRTSRLSHAVEKRRALRYSHEVRRMSFLWNSY